MDPFRSRELGGLRCPALIKALHRLASAHARDGGGVTDHLWELRELLE